MFKYYIYVFNKLVYITSDIKAAYRLYVINDNTVIKVKRGN